MYVRFLMIAALAVSTVIGQNNDRIIGGEDAKPGQFPYQVCTIQNFQNHSIQYVKLLDSFRFLGAMML